MTTDAQYSLQDFVDVEIHRLNRFITWYEGNKECDLDGEFPSHRDYWSEWLAVYNDFE